MTGNMLSAYFSKGCDSRELFERLKIAKDPSFEKYLNKLNVIKLDVNAVYSNLSKKEQEEKVDRATRDITPIFNGAVVKELIPAFPDCSISEDDSSRKFVKRTTELHLKKYSGDLLFVGVNYDEKTKEHRCVIEKFVK